MTNSFSFIVIADSHIRPSDQEIDAYPSNALMVERNNHIVDLCNRVDAEFVIHLGDIVHPLPIEETHLEAIDLAKGVYANLKHPIHFVAGNHDVGDKPNSFVAVPAVDEENYLVFEEAWGPSHHSFDVGDCHFVLLDTQVMNTGLKRELEQQTWLETDLETAREEGKRLFLFTHYPPYVRDSDENEHYDNIGEPARSLLLELLVSNKVEALFSGHVHNFLYNKYCETDLYVAPSTAFVRPDYSELISVAPLAENGRDDPPKLGMFVVNVSKESHTTEPVRLYGSPLSNDTATERLSAVTDAGWESSVGVTLRHGWTNVTDFPTAGLDEFNRKRIRNDTTLLALWEARIRNLRIPLVDLLTPDSKDRIRELTRRGMRFSVFSAGVPDEATMKSVSSQQSILNRWEIIVPPELFADAIRATEQVDLGDIDLAIAPILPIGESDSSLHHFVSTGFSIGEDHHLDSLIRLDTNLTSDTILFRLPWTNDIEDSIKRAGSTAEKNDRRGVVIIELPRAGESSTFTDDDKIADRVAESVRAAGREPRVAVYLGSFMDHDRGYYPRHGLIDRAFNPRKALYKLIEESIAVSEG